MDENEDDSITAKRSPESLIGWATRVASLIIETSFSIYELHSSTPR
jgi:hypothetical protein